MSGRMDKTVIAKGTLKRIHINQHNIKSNAVENGEPWKQVITVKTYYYNIKANHVEIKGESEVVYRPADPLSCGAKVWIETRAEVEVYHEDN